VATHSTFFCLQVAFTFDAGPNACLYLLECEVPKLVSVICHIFPPENEGAEYLQGIPVEKQALSQVNKNTVSISFRFHKTHLISVTELSNGT
jgi:diphosphomevalonate decarboxylase